jgi:hypothetical protein
VVQLDDEIFGVAFRSVEVNIGSGIFSAQRDWSLTLSVYCEESG